MMNVASKPEDRVRAVLLSHAGEIVQTIKLLHAAFGPNLPQGSLLKLNRIISALIADEEPIERTKWGCRIVLPCETDALWASAGFVDGLVEGAHSQADLFGEAVP